MLTDEQLNALIHTLLDERRRRRAERRVQPAPEPKTELSAFGASMYRPHTRDHRFTVLDLASALYGPAAKSRELRSRVTSAAIVAGAVGIGKGRVNRPHGEAYADYLYSVVDWDAFTPRLLAQLS